MAGAPTEAELERILIELRDRYGPLPASILNLAEYGRIRILADAIGVESIDRDHDTVVVKFSPRTQVEPTRLLAVIEGRADVTLVPPGLLRIDLRAARPDRSAPGAPESWWTSRATAGAVTPGFNRRAMTRRPTAEPRGAGGLFSRLGGLLAQLSDSNDLG